MGKNGSMVICPGCGLTLPAVDDSPPGRCNASAECLRMYSDLMCYTVAKQDEEFIHQHAVDAYAAQHAGGTTRNITVAFGLIGLYLTLERGYTGKQVQLAHMLLARVRKDWPRLEPPLIPAHVTVMDILRVKDGPHKDTLIREWMAAVWESWGDRQEWVRGVTEEILVRGRR